ncbi:DNA replication complex GINS protein SLD5-like [Acanthaster planci]|uniref:DNA replication complex GINS protein SLD5 n=1 Tax=Acanthaster planci TaxID=133434 RepID=A0A8B7YNT6_ACAPL|nr:DNA replication complex GINS protein SLD5-like [Acanthaster planci]XP_022094333.1 DNA replication complex GINS protein SLD5-like [Acanthaster planci]
MASIDDDINEEWSDDEVEMTAADVLQKLEEAWLNEKFSPDLLESKSELVDCMLEQIQQMESNISRCKKGDFRIIVHKMEIDRIRYILSSYLRIRLGKIEKYFHNILKKEAARKDDEPSRLSQEEFAFAKEFAENTDNHFKSVALRHMPPNLQALEQDKRAPKPNLDAYVFLRANQKQEQVLIEPELEDDQNAEVIDLEESAQYIMRYQPIASLVTGGAVSLI